MAKKKTQSSSLLIALGSPAVILFLYAANMQVHPSEASSQVARLESDLQTVKDAEVSLNQRVDVAEQLRVGQENLAVAQTRLDDLRRQSGELMRGEVTGMDELEHGREINRVLATAGMRLVDEHPISSQASGTGMLGTLADATKKLGNTLTELASEEADNTTIALPPELSLDVNPIEWMASQRALRVGKFDGPETRGIELKLVGDYRSMVAGLEAVVDACPGVVVSSVAFEKPAARIAGAVPLIWSLQLQMRPVPPSSSNAMTVSNDARISRPASEVESAGRRLNAEIDTYFAAKPIIEGAD